MIKRLKLIVVFVLLFCLNISFANKVIKFQNAPDHLSVEEITDLIKKADIALDTLKRVNPFHGGVMVYYLGNILLLPNGYQHVYIFENGAFRNLSSSPFNGHNFYAIKYVYKDTLFSFGGMGHWKANNQMTFYNMETKAWEYVPMESEKIDTHFGGPVIEFENEDRIIVIYNVERKPSGVLINSKIRAYEISKENGRVKPIKNISIPEKLASRINVHTDNYALHIFSHGAYIVDQKALQYKFASFDANPKLTLVSKNQDFYFLGMDFSITGDSILAFKDYQLIESFNLGKIYNELDNEPIDMMQGGFLPYYLGALFILMASLVIWKIPKQKKPISKDFPYPELLAYYDQIIDKAKLDECLHLDFMKEQSKANKRAEILKNIATHYSAEVKIKRVKNTEDSRVYDYEIRRPTYLNKF